VGKVCDVKPIRLSTTGCAVWRCLTSVKETSLLGWVSLDFVRTGLSNMRLCCAFPFALAGLFLYHSVNKMRIMQFHILTYLNFEQDLISDNVVLRLKRCSVCKKILCQKS